MFIDLVTLADMISIGTLLAFSVVCLGVLIIRKREADSSVRKRRIQLQQQQQQDQDNNNDYKSIKDSDAYTPLLSSSSSQSPSPPQSQSQSQSPPNQNQFDRYFYYRYRYYIISLSHSVVFAITMTVFTLLSVLVNLGLIHDWPTQTVLIPLSIPLVLTVIWIHFLLSPNIHPAAAKTITNKKSSLLSSNRNNNNNSNGNDIDDIDDNDNDSDGMGSKKRKSTFLTPCVPLVPCIGMIIINLLYSLSLS